MWISDFKYFHSYSTLYFISSPKPKRQTEGGNKPLQFVFLNESVSPLRDKPRYTTIYNLLHVTKLTDNTSLVFYVLLTSASWNGFDLMVKLPKSIDS